MNIDWSSIILNDRPPDLVWRDLFSSLLAYIKTDSPVTGLHERTVTPDRLLSEAAWQLWEAYPGSARRASAALNEWCNKPAASGRAVLVLDALSLRELSILLKGAELHGFRPHHIDLAGSECPSTTEQFAKALGVPSRSSLAHDNKPGTFSCFHGGDVYTDMISLPFEDCALPPAQNVFIWHTWLDDLIHLQHKTPEQVSTIASATLQSAGFWTFITRLRQGRSLVITSDHGYAVSKRFSSEVEDPEAIELLRKTFGASRYRQSAELWEQRLMPPTVMSHNGHHIVMGQRKWKAPGGFPHICHGGMSLLEVAVPWVEFGSL
jgi:hypothetical protein